ncbi:MAG: glycosyltransferase [Candidatus Symbiothrix sp.]|nr:glycosyltransferase [Candidatus Symbiothrix sp.]
MKFLFVVQGEGRGHLTQSITLAKMLQKHGHTVCAVLVGKSNRRELPAFFHREMPAPVHRFDSPNFPPPTGTDRAKTWATIRYNLWRLPHYLKGLFFLKKKIREFQPDVVINFYEMLVGLAYVLCPPRAPYICIAHQYSFLHPGYCFPAENESELRSLKLLTRVTCLRASKLFVLSIHEQQNNDNRFVFVPPLLRNEVFTVQPTKGDYLHGYLLNANYANDIITWQKQHPDVSLHFFWDKKDADKETVINDRLSFHQLDDKLFLNYMAGCKGYATTAGFESVCEAAYLGKPVLMVPTHIEQACNAYEFAQAGFGIASGHFDLDALLAFTSQYNENPAFRSWVEQSEERWMKELTNLINIKNTKNHG